MLILVLIETKSNEVLAMTEKVYIMWENTCIAVLKADFDTTHVEVTNYIDDRFKLPFGLREDITLDEYEGFLRYRCFPQRRENAEQLLHTTGISFYAVRDILKKTHGVKNEDKLWLSFGSYPAGEYSQLRARESYNLFDHTDRGYKRNIALDNALGIAHLRINPEFCIYNELLTNGNQRKFRYRDTWYKLDFMGVEGLSEVLCSRLADALHLKHVEYKPLVQLDESGHSFNNVKNRGCTSKHFLGEDECEYTLYRLLAYHTGDMICLNMFNRPDIAAEARMEAATARMTPLVGEAVWKETLGTVLLFDYLTVNDDRHLNNISFIYNQRTQTFKPAPLFDNGSALLSGLPVNITDTGRLRAKPFSTSFTRQVNCCMKLLGYDSIPALEPRITLAVDDLVMIYGAELVARAIWVLRNTLKTYNVKLEVADV